MSSVIELPESGYAVKQVYAGEQVVQPRDPSSDKDSGNATFGWDWRYVPDSAQKEFEVILSLSIHPNVARPEFVRVSAVGRFEVVGKSPAVSLDDFVGAQAVAILLPYARQFISNLTANSPLGCFYLPTINVAKLMEPVDRAKATGAIERQSSQGGA